MFVRKKNNLKINTKPTKIQKYVCIHVFLQRVIVLRYIRDHICMLSRKDLNMPGSTHNLTTIHVILLPAILCCPLGAGTAEHACRLAAVERAHDGIIETEAHTAQSAELLSTFWPRHLPEWMRGGFLCLLGQCLIKKNKNTKEKEVSWSFLVEILDLHMTDSNYYHILCNVHKQHC